MDATRKGRRVRASSGRRERGGLSTRDKEVLDNAVKAYMTAQRQAAKAEEAMKEALSIAGGIMKTALMDKYMNTQGVVEYKPPRSVSRTVIDSRLFRDAVQNDDEFFSSITVGVTAAKKVLPEKVIDRISTKTKPEPKPPVASIRARTDKDQ